MDIGIHLILGVIFGIISAAVAANKGRSVVGWFFVGFLIGLIGMIIILCMSNLNDEKARQAHIEVENRRLREQVRQEQMKLESLRNYTTARLDLHDQHLGLDTRVQLPGGQPAPYMLSNNAPPPGAVAPPQAAAGQVYQPADSAGWYFESNGETHGPVPGGTIRQMIASGQLRNSTLLWAEHMADWQPAHLVPEFRGILYT